MKEETAFQSADYLDFELEIGPGTGRDYPVTARGLLAGEARAVMRFPFDELQLESRLKDIQLALLLPAETRRRVPTAQEQGVQRFGCELFDALMVGEIRSAYDISWRQAEAQGKGLRVKLRVQSPALASLPWEFLYDSREGEYLCLMSDRPVVRYIETPQPVKPLTLAAPLRILGMIASPAGLPELNAEQEKLRLAKATEKLQAQGLVELTWLEGQTWRDLQRAMRGGPWHIFHFVGHGGFDPLRDEGLIVVADDAGQPHYLTATDLSRLLADHKPLRLVLLNACEGARGGSRDIFSSTASILVRRGVPAVVAMQYPVTDRAAVEFASSFYESLADGLPADAAVAEARKAVSIAGAGTAEWGTPVLFMRAPDGRIFNITLAQEPADLAPTPPPAPAPDPSPRPVTPARRRWLWPAIGGVVGLIAIVVAVFIATRVMTTSKPPTATAMLVPTLGIGSSMVSEKDGMMLLYVPAGEFLMGSAYGDSDAADDEEPQHKVFLDAFWIDRTEVTNAMFASFVEATGYKTDAEKAGSGDILREAEQIVKEMMGANWQHPRGPDSDRAGLDKNPVVQVSWNDALAYCVWAGRRLPTEAEWEKAARGPDGRKYPWGDAWDVANTKRLNFADRNLTGDWTDKTADDGCKFTAPVGVYGTAGASPYAAVDMAGNVWEWVADMYDEKYFASSPEKNPLGPDSEQYRVLRGGSWGDDKFNVRAAVRRQNLPEARDESFGFRCARSP